MVDLNAGRASKLHIDTVSKKWNDLSDRVESLLVELEGTASRYRVCLPPFSPPQKKSVCALDVSLVRPSLTFCSCFLYFLMSLIFGVCSWYPYTWWFFSL